MPHHLTTAQAASLLSCSELRVLEFVAEGLLSETFAGIPLSQVAELLSTGIPGPQVPSER
ncbi:MAG: hypothetical protein JKY65_05965 [Planctomycetes bacterium]|nr:hypothetical protein [Planctomycetota bacterium]